MTTCIQCENPIVKFIQYIDAQITAQGITTQVAANALVNDTLEAGYWISNRINNHICCPDCPNEDCADGVYFIGNIAKFELFAPLMEITGRDVDPTKLCCTNYYLSVEDYDTFFTTVGCSGLFSCCNSFNTECLDKYIVLGRALSGGFPPVRSLIEYSTIDGNTSLCAIVETLENVSLLCQLAIMQEAMVNMIVSCSCRPGYTGVMNINRFEGCVNQS